MKKQFAIVAVGTIFFGSITFAKQALDPDSRDALAQSFLDDAARQYADISHKEKNPDVQYRLAETLYKQAGIIPRRMQRTGNESEINTLSGQQKKLLNQALGVVVPLAEGCRNQEQCDPPVLLKGMILRDLGQPEKAKSEFERLLTYSTETDWKSLSRLYLSEIFADKKDYPAAIALLEPLKHQARNRLVAIALEHLSYCLYQAGSYQQALDTNRELLAVTLKESTLNKNRRKDTVALNAALFYSGAIQSHTEGFSGSEAYRYFSTLLEEPQLTSAIQVFPTLLSDVDNLKNIEQFTDQLVANRPSFSETNSLLLSTIEKEGLRGKFSELNKHLEAWETIDSKSSRSEWQERAQNVDHTLSTVEKVARTATFKSKDNERTEALTTLKGVYQARLRYFGADPVRLATNYFNLAAIELGLGHLGMAESDYRKVVRLANRKTLHAMAAEASAKSIALRRTQLLTLAGHAKNDAKEVETLLSDTRGSVNEWNSWTAQHLKEFDGRLIEEVAFDFAQKWPSQNDEQLNRYVAQFPNSKHTATIVKLALANFADQQNWKGLLKETEQLRRAKLSNEMIALLDFTDGETEYRLMRDQANQGQVEDALEYADKVVEKNQDHPEKMLKAAFASLSLGAELANKLRRWTQSIHYLELANRAFPSKDLEAKRNLLAGWNAEEHLDLSAALTAYENYLALLDSDKVILPTNTLITRQNLQGRVLFLALTSSDSDTMQRVAKDGHVCSADYSLLCDQLRGLAQLKTATKTEIKLDSHPPETRWIWALAKSNQSDIRSLPTDRKLALLRSFAPYQREAKHVFDVDPYLQLSQTTPETYQSIADDLKKDNEWVHSAEKIAARIEILKRLDSAAQVLASYLGSSGLATLQTLRDLYGATSEKLILSAKNPETESDQKALLGQIAESLEKRRTELTKLIASRNENIGSPVTRELAASLGSSELASTQPTMRMAECLESAVPSPAWPMEWKSDRQAKKVFEQQLAQASKEKKWARVGYLLELNRKYKWVIPPTEDSAISNRLATADNSTK